MFLTMFGDTLMVPIVFSFSALLHAYQSMPQSILQSTWDHIQSSARSAYTAGPVAWSKNNIILGYHNQNLAPFSPKRSI